MLSPLPSLAALPIVVDPRLDDIYVVAWQGDRPYVIGSQSAFGSIFAVHLARAYIPPGLERIGIALG